MRYVIIGNGTAAAGCIEGIRSVDAEGQITVISAEKHPVYCRPLISYYLEGKTDTKKMLYRPEDFYEKNNCTVLYSKKATKIDRAKKSVTLDDGSALSYDALCVATGSSPFVPPMEGLDGVKNKFSFMTLDDALSLEAAITKDSRILIIGAGLIGLKCAEGISALGAAGITVCDLADRVLSSILDAKGAALMQRRLEEAAGISFLLGDSVSRFENDVAFMKSGKRVEFDILVLAVGVRANIALFRDIGGACGRGITVDDHMKTSVDGIYAAGDCTESKDISDNSIKVMALLPNAYMQGKCAGENMAGGDSVFDNAIPMNSIGFFGLHAMTAGSRAPQEDGGTVFDESDTQSIKKLYVKDGRLTGFMLIGNTDRAGIYTSLIRNKTPLDTLNFEMLKKMPTLYAFGKDYRKDKLGGVKNHAN